MKTFIVLGMRTGTSVLTSIIHRWGINMGREFRAGDEHNEVGYFEDAQMLRAVTSIIGNRFERCAPITHFDIEQLRQFKELINDRQQDVWGFKAPGVCFMLRAVDMFVPDPHYILCIRDVRQMARSLADVKTHDLPHGFNHINYCQMFLDTMYEETRGKKRTIIQYEDLIKYPVETLVKLKGFLGVDINNNLFEEGKALIKPNLKHAY